MSDYTAALLMAQLQGGRKPRPKEAEEPKLTGASAVIAERARRYVGEGSVPPLDRPEGDDKRFKERALELAIEHGVSRADSEAMVREELRQQAADAQSRGFHEAMVARNRREPDETFNEAVKQARKPRVQRLPNGDPVPGTTVNDLIADDVRNPMVEKLRVAALGSYADLVELGLVPADE